MPVIAKCNMCLNDNIPGAGTRFGTKFGQDFHVCISLPGPWLLAKIRLTTKTSKVNTQLYVKGLSADYIHFLTDSQRKLERRTQFSQINHVFLIPL